MIFVGCDWSKIELHRTLMSVLMLFELCVLEVLKNKTLKTITKNYLTNKR